MIIGKFTVVIAIRVDNPAWPRYQIFCGTKFIGVQYSMPSISDCEWLAKGGLFAYGPQDTSKYGERINRAYGKSRKASADLATEPAE